MIALLIGASVFAGVVLGWYGYKASVRIAVWGRNMNECDRIFQMASEHTDDGRLQGSGNVPAILPIAGKHLRAESAGSK
jgi:hypothetical protein